MSLYISLLSLFFCLFVCLSLSPHPCDFNTFGLPILSHPTVLEFPGGEAVEDAIIRQVLLNCGFFTGIRDEVTTTAVLGTLACVASSTRGTELLLNAHMVDSLVRRVYNLLKEQPGSRQHELGVGFLCWAYFNAPEEKRSVLTVLSG